MPADNIELIRLEGSSMWPYFKTGDLVALDREGSELFEGALVAVKLKNHSHPFVHRCLNPNSNLFKGDWQKRQDHTPLNQQEWKRLVKGRCLAQAGIIKIAPQMPNRYRLVGSTVARLNRYNERSYILFHRAAALAISASGYFLRFCETYWIRK